MMPVLARHTWVQTERLLTRWAHDAQTVIEALLLPVGFLVALDLVSVSRFRRFPATVPYTALFRWPCLSAPHSEHRRRVSG